jgi:hypothetical protein
MIQIKKKGWQVFSRNILIERNSMMAAILQRVYMKIPRMSINSPGELLTSRSRAGVLPHLVPMLRVGTLFLIVKHPPFNPLCVIILFSMPRQERGHERFTLLVDTIEILV